MPSNVKQKPPEKGQARTRLARRAVIDAAREMFIEGGYAATTIAAISTRADVPEPTIYRLFSSKVGILKALLDVSIAGDDEPVAVADRAVLALLLDEPDIDKVFSRFAAFVTQINQRTTDLYYALTRAAASDPDAAVLLAGLRKQREGGQEQIVRTLHRKQKLRAGLKAREAADIVHALMSPEVYRLLVIDRGWSGEQFQRWAAQLLGQQLT